MLLTILQTINFFDSFSSSSTNRILIETRLDVCAYLLTYHDENYNWQTMNEKLKWISYRLT